MLYMRIDRANVAISVQVNELGPKRGRIWFKGTSYNYNMFTMFGHMHDVLFKITHEPGVVYYFRTPVEQ